MEESKCSAGTRMTFDKQAQRKHSASTAQAQHKHSALIVESPLRQRT